MDEKYDIIKILYENLATQKIENEISYMVFKRLKDWGEQKN